MSDKLTDETIAHQVELAIGQLDSLSIPPSVAAQLFPQLLQSQGLPSALADTVESDPALTAKIFSLLGEEGLSFTDGKITVRRALDKLPAHIVRNALFSVKFSPSFGHDNQRIMSKKQLILHALAVACCAKEIAENSSLSVDGQLAYFAGLLHDIGKLALEQVMPKSFARIAEEARAQNASSWVIEQKHLSTDHAILGKRLAQKWHLPSEITLAIWLHHSDTAAISQNMPEARLAGIVQLADSVARQVNIGQSGSYDTPDSTERIALSAGITPEQLEQIRSELSGKVAEKSKVLGLDLPNAAVKCFDVIHTAVGKLARDKTELLLENRRLQTSSSQLDFIKDFLLSINPNTSPIEAAESFAVRWQKFYQTGKVCLYLKPAAGSELIEAVVVENLSQSRIVYLKAPAETGAIPQVSAKDFVIFNAEDYAGWLFEQLEVDFDLRQAKLLPLLSADRVVGAIVFEVRYPGDLELFREEFKTGACIAGAILDMAVAGGTQQRFAEQFARLLAEFRNTQRRVDSSSSLNALAEMAGGAAHELNNPLSVISGRAQLLAESESDPEKKQILEQIKKSTSEISGIIDELMTFAKPSPPRPTQTDIKEMLDEAMQLASRKTNVEQADVEVEVAESVEKVFVDSGQVVSAIANIISNSLESYPNGHGPVNVSAAVDESADFVRVTVRDSGCGMDRETLQKATQPFFSGQQAGRKRGMGLAHAVRLIELNGGRLNIESEPGSGTTVTIYLPPDRNIRGQACK